MKHHLFIRDMITEGKRYLAGECSIIELNNYINRCIKMANPLEMHPAIMEIAKEWSSMANRCWNEWGAEKDVLPEADFKVWLQQQIEL